MKGSLLLDLALLVLPPLSLALLVTAHVAIVARLAGREPRWRAAVAFVLPPFALLWGTRAAMKGWCRVFVGALLAYASSLLLASVS